METETTRYRSTEARQSGPVRWFINQFGAGREKGDSGVSVTASTGMLGASRMTQPGSRKVHVHKRASRWLEQSELWPTETKESFVEASVTSDLITQANVEEKVPFVQVKKLRRPAPRVLASDRRTIVTARSAQTVDKVGSHVVRANKIARFLNVTGAIEGIKHGGGIHFDMPGRGHFQSLRLWKGSSEIPVYSSVQI